jgi:starch phosphorylase
VEGVTGWSIGESWEGEPDPRREAAQLYVKLEEIAATFYGRPEAFARIMRHAIALNGSFFNAQRMVEQYARGAYRLGPED